MKNKKQFTLIELIIVIIVIGILAAMAMPKFNGVVRDAKISAMIRDKETLEKTMILYSQKHNELPLLSNDEEFIIANKGISLTKIVFAEDNINEDMKTIYLSLQETLKHYNDSEESLYRIDINELKDNFSKNIKNGYKRYDKDFYVYSTKTGNVYYYGSMINGNGTIQHDEYDTLLREDKLIDKKVSIDPSINKAPKIELITDLSKITIEKDIKWEYTFNDEDKEPTKISFILDNIEYDNINKVPTKLEEGEHTLKIKMQDSKGLWSNEIIKTFGIARGLVSLNIGEQIASKIDLDGNLYLWGSNSYGALGVGEGEFFKTPQLISLPNQVKVKSIKLSFFFSTALGKDGKVYSWGFNSYGQVGVGNNEQQNTPKKVLLPENISIKEISTGTYHSLALSSDGDLYSWGDNRYGQLGIGNNDNQNIPQKVNFPKGVKIKEMQSGCYHSIVIGTDDNVYTWGYNNKGVLLTGDTKNQNLPIKMQLPEGLKPLKVYAGEYQSMVLCNDGNLYAAGSTNYGALGIGNATTNKYIPVKVALPENVKPVEVALGKAHGIVIGDDGNIYAWGWNNNGQVGVGNMSNQSTPQKVTLPNGDIPKKIIAYSQASLAICENGNIYFWGSDPRSLFKIYNSTIALVPTLQTGI